MSDRVRAALAAALSADAVRAAEPHELVEPRGQWQGRAACVALPRSTAEVAAAVGVAARLRVPVVPYGGGTGLVGGQVMPDGVAPILLSLARMTAIRDVDPAGGTMTVEAGAILSDVQAAAAEAGRLFPLSLASEGSARIGGLLSTNAGGVNVLRYGTARELCLGVEAVLPDGSVMHGLRRLRKDNTGYDLRHLLIGAEGTLGVITAAVLRLYPRPARQGTALIAVRDPAAAVELLGRALAGEGVSAFELISGQGLRFLSETGVPVRQPFADPPAWSVLVELGLPEDADPDARLAAVFEAAVEDGLASDGVVAQSAAQRRDLWHLRETIPEANKRVGAIVSNDISLPIAAVPDFLTAADARIRAAGRFRINAFGHLGDGNLHYNVFPPEGVSKADIADRAADLREIVETEVAARAGSFSAEHGVGRLKVATLERYGDPARLAAMRAIKAALDPLGIMNPGAVLRAQGSGDAPAPQAVSR
ncbi:FAD-binding oxidoreductase [Rhodobacteraceae bacterium CCMM004]|nr:FAD-binding oxidoreductase [Rhodobacteraceae bacterium CCMM004]